MGAGERQLPPFGSLSVCECVRALGGDFSEGYPYQGNCSDCSLTPVLGGFIHSIIISVHFFKSQQRRGSVAFLYILPKTGCE